MKKSLTPFGVLFHADKYGKNFAWGGPTQNFPVFNLQAFANLLAKACDLTTSKSSEEPLQAGFCPCTIVENWSLASEAHAKAVFHGQLSIGRA